MSKASEWARSAAEAPNIVFETEGYRVKAKVVDVYGPDPTLDADCALGLLDTNGNQIGLRVENALALARWIQETFGENPADELRLAE